MSEQDGSPISHYLRVSDQIASIKDGSFVSQTPLTSEEEKEHLRQLRSQRKEYERTLLNQSRNNNPLKH